MATRAPKSTDPIGASAMDGDTAVTDTTAVQGVRMQVKLRELVDRVIDRTGAKKNEVKTITEAVLQVMGTALAEGEDLNLPGFGKVMVKRDKDGEKARILTAKIRQAKPAALGA